jgi:hypothetical protein
MQLMGVAEFIIGRAIARPVGSTYSYALIAIIEGSHNISAMAARSVSPCGRGSGRGVAAYRQMKIHHLNRTVILQFRLLSLSGC